VGSFPFVSCLCVISVFLGGSFISSAETTYSFSRFDVPDAVATPPNITVATLPTGINDAAQIIGSFIVSDPVDFRKVSTHSFFKDGETFSSIEVPGSSFNRLTGINDAGQIVGYFVNFFDATERVFVKDGADFTTIEVPGAFSYGQTLAINNAGQIAGTFFDPFDDTNASRQHVYIKKGDDFTIIDVPYDDDAYKRVSISRITGMNDVGQIIGWFDNGRNFLLDGETFMTIDTPEDLNSRGERLQYFVCGINDAGQMVGYFNDGDTGRPHGFFKDGSAFTTIDVPGAVSTRVLGITTTGQIVGDFDGHGFLGIPTSEVPDPTTSVRPDR
jgi:uncharacterized membrane protein